MKKQIRSLLAMILAAVMLLSACGSDADVNTNVTEAPVTQAVASGTPADITDSPDPGKKDEPAEPTPANTAVSDGTTVDTVQVKSLSMTVNSGSGELKVSRRKLPETKAKWN